MASDTYPHNQSNLIDLPRLSSKDDLLGQKNYVDAFSAFIKDAETPMTIAVQGEWGCGKTSLMNAIASEVCANYHQICRTEKPAEEPPEAKDRPYLGVWINTWQYSLLKNDSDAQIAVIKGVARELSAQMDQLMGKSAAVKEAGRKLLSSIGGIALTAAKVGVSAAGLNPLSLNGLDEMVRTQENGPEYFRDQLRKTIVKYLDEYNGQHRRVKGFIFFVDDLDRLDPPVAVQVLSLLKNLFEVPQSIFVLAIDYEVVVQGLASRFGARTEANEREFRSFFDKIIQLTFRVPIESYQLETFLVDMLKKIQYCKPRLLENEAFLKTVTDFTLHSCGKNPRSIKRMLNTLSLTRKIHAIRQPELERTDSTLFLQILFGIVCLQSAYPRIYDELVRKPNLFDWIEADASDGTAGGEVKTITDFDEEDISPQDFDLEAFIQLDPWVKKRKTAVQKLLFRLLELIMRGKLRLAKTSGGEAAVQRTTKDYVNQVIQAARFTAAEEDVEEYQFGSLDEFIQYWQEKGIKESILENLRDFSRALPRMFDGDLTIEFSESRVLFRAVQLNEAGKIVRSKVITTAEVEPKGVVIRAGRSYKLGLLPKGMKRNLSFARRVERVEELTEADLKPIKERFKAFMGTGRVAARWVKVLEEMRAEAEQSVEDDAQGEGEAALDAAAPVANEEAKAE